MAGIQPFQVARRSRSFYLPNHRAQSPVTSFHLLRSIDSDAFHSAHQGFLHFVRCVFPSTHPISGMAHVKARIQMDKMFFLAMAMVGALGSCNDVAGPSRLPLGNRAVDCRAGEGQVFYDLGREVRQLMLWRLRQPTLREGMPAELTCEAALALLPGMDLTGRYASYQYLARGAYRTCFCDGLLAPHAPPHHYEHE